MSKVSRGNLSDLRGVVRLAVDGTVGVTNIVERMHRTIQLTPAPLGKSNTGTTGGLTGFVYRSIRATTRLVGKGLDVGMAPFTTLLPEDSSTAARDAFVSVINGLHGDHLVRTDNPLAINMGFWHKGQQLDWQTPDAKPGIPQGAAINAKAMTGKILLFVHGLCLNDNHWTCDGHNHGEVLAGDLGYTPLYLRYNTGLSIAENGRKLSAILQRLLGDWPQPVTDLSIVGHSMGGLVARSACHQARIAGHDWLQLLHKMVFMGSPHHGAPLERGGERLEYVMDLSPYAAPFTRIGKIRSVGITNLRYGSITARDREFVPLPKGVKCYAIAATLGKKQNRISERLVGDGLVPLDSALGQHKDPKRILDIPESHQWIGYDMGHIELLRRPEPYKQLRGWLK
jgi:pimeloyl-ACP methyl ester carboxylesterase